MGVTTMKKRFKKKPRTRKCRASFIAKCDEASDWGYDFNDRSPGEYFHLCKRVFVGLTGIKLRRGNRVRFTVEIL